MTAVFVDLDGVLADFWSAAVRLHGRDPAAVAPEDRARWDMASWLTGGDARAFWAPVAAAGAAFWEGLEPYPWARALWDGLVRRWPRTTVLTATTTEPSASAGKHAWVERHLGTRAFLVGGADKAVVAGPGKALVDDAPRNLEAWRAAGGVAVGLAQPWCPEGVAPGRVAWEIERGLGR